MGGPVHGIAVGGPFAYMYLAELRVVVPLSVLGG